VKSSLETTVSQSGRVDKYRLSEGRLQFQASGRREWRTLDYPDLQHHLALNTPVAKWLGHLTSVEMWLGSSPPRNNPAIPAQ
jgi:hypothetical protein